ncbi:MAG: hypothetical protein ACI9CA_001882, partial [Natronomonas sp.]
RPDEREAKAGETVDRAGDEDDHGDTGDKGW